MNPRIPYNPDKRHTGAGSEGGGCVVRLFWLLVPALALAVIWAVHTYGLGGAIAALGATAGNLLPPLVTETPAPAGPAPTGTPMPVDATDSVPTDPPLPTSTLRPA